MSVLLPATGSNRKGKDKKKKSLRIRKNKDSDPGHGGSVEPSMIKPPTRDCCGKESSKRRTKESTDNDENSTVQSKNKTPAGSKRKEKDVCLTAEQESANAALVKHCTAENFLQTAKDEFTEIQALEIDPALHARCCQSKDRNRFPDTIPCLDATRVVLQAGHDGVKPTDDFIHASKIVIDKLERPYIAAQAPKDGYFEDFWKMIFQEGSTTVLVLFSYFEEGKQVCEELYPAEVGTYKYFGKMFLNNKKSDTLDTFTINTLELLPEGCSNSLIVRIASTNTWKDHGVSTKIRSILKIGRWVREQETGPVTVVSTSGCGRAGTFIAIDCLHQLLIKGNEIKVAETVKNIRRQRACAVENMIQYLFIYHSLMDYLRAKDDKRYGAAYKQFFTNVKQKKIEEKT